MSEFDGLAEEIDASMSPQTMAAAPVMGVGATVTRVVSALRAAGIPWMTIFGLVVKIVPIVVQGIKDGKTFAQIVSEILAAILSGQLT